MPIVEPGRGVEQNGQVPPVIACLNGLAVADAERQGEALEDHVVVDVDRAVARWPHDVLAFPFEPDRQPVGGVQDVSARPVHLVGTERALRRDPNDARLALLEESDGASGHRRGGGEQPAGVDVADDEFVEAGHDPQREARSRVESGDSSEQFLHVRSACQSARIFSTHALRDRIIPCETIVYGAKMSKAWKPPGQTCSSASPPASQSPVA